MAFGQSLSLCFGVLGRREALPQATVKKAFGQQVGVEDAAN